MTNELKLPIGQTHPLGNSKLPCGARSACLKVGSRQSGLLANRNAIDRIPPPGVSDYAASPWRIRRRTRGCDRSRSVAVVRDQITGEEIRSDPGVGRGDLEGIEILVGVGDDL